MRAVVSPPSSGSASPVAGLFLNASSRDRHFLAQQKAFRRQALFRSQSGNRVKLHPTSPLLCRRHSARYAGHPSLGLSSMSIWQRPGPAVPFTAGEKVLAAGALVVLAILAVSAFSSDGGSERKPPDRVRSTSQQHDARHGLTIEEAEHLGAQQAAKRAILPQALDSEAECAAEITTHSIMLGITAPEKLASLVLATCGAIIATVYDGVDSAPTEAGRSAFVSRESKSIALTALKNCPTPNAAAFHLGAHESCSG